jgi:hypothetical protein
MQVYIHDCIPAQRGYMFLYGVYPLTAVPRLIRITNNP